MKKQGKEHHVQVNNGLVNVTIEVEKLQALFNKGELCVADIKPLDSQSKAYLWDLCLSSCAKRLRCNVVLVEQPKTCSPETYTSETCSYGVGLQG